MPTFDTPEPIFALIDIAAGDVRITASDRADTVVEVRPSDEFDETDVRAAEQTRIEYAQGKLLVRTPENNTRSLFRWISWSGSIVVTVDLPTGSRVEANATADFHCEGRLGESTFKTATGNIWLDQTGPLRLNAADGDITVTRSVGRAEVTTANGDIRIRQIDGPATIRTANGGITVGEVTGDLQLNTAYGDITVDRALASVNAKTAAGSIRIGEAVRGLVTLETAYGRLEVGVREGTAAWLDVSAPYGSVRNHLNAADGPEPTDETVEVRARAYYGDVVIRRS
ncbi:DUF4097 family beta strand repeat-containing protein [Streptosporangium carneum]|uniref:DUF4097 domain-containing protein n=1 Tax=Streptosporangium carneum TaxID=47481 RepID=A0A9W6HXC6_9ACTN|nr:DUF4097 family beta strand repeat-containing protein [Streptosporangium carneum]GLK08130.1 hypothetical protein GCM10017600_15350 [Streptosporangium carneum]